MSAPSRAAIAVTFLADDAHARRAALSWPLLPEGLSERELLATWSRASGVPRSRLRRISDVLRGHGICRDDRTVDEEALRVIQHFAAESLRGTQRRPR